MHPNDLEQLAAKKLKQLRAPHAPRTLMPRVMMAIASLQARPWYARPWLAWPIGWRVASAAVVLTVLAATSVGVHLAFQTFSPEALPAGRAVIGWFSAVVQSGSTAARGMAAIWRTVVEPLALLALVPVLLMCMASLIFGAALSRLAFGGPSRT